MDIDTISFGALIYEIVTGYTLKNLSQLDSYPPTVPKEALEVINLILKDSEKTPSLEDIAQMPFLNIKLKNSKTEPIQFDDKIKKILTAATHEAKQLQGGLMASSGRSSVPKSPKKKYSQTKSFPSKTNISFIAFCLDDVESSFTYANTTSSSYSSSTSSTASSRSTTPSRRTASSPATIRFDTSGPWT